MGKTKKEKIAELSTALQTAIEAPVPVNPTCHISKSKYMAGLQCPKREYLQVRRPELAVSVDDGLKQQGIEVGSLAQRAFPGGVRVAGDHMHLSDAIRSTRELVANCEVPAIFEATFQHSGVLVRTDVLKRNGVGFHLTEVKSATKIKPEYTDDVSVQKYVLAGCGVRVQNTNLMHLSRDYVYDGTLGTDGQCVYDISRLFVSEEVQPRSAGDVTRTLDEQFKILAQPEPPDIEPSDECDSLSYCEFYKQCHPVWPDDDVRSLPIAGRKTKALRTSPRLFLTARLCETGTCPAHVFGAPSGAGRPAKKTYGLVHAGTNGIRSTREASAPPVFTSGLKPNVYRAADGRRIRIGTQGRIGAIPCRHRRAFLNITETNRRIAEQFNEAFNRGDLDEAVSCFAEDCQNHGRKVGRAGVRAVLGEIKTNFPDARLTTLNSVAEGEWVVVRCTYSGTHRGTSRFPVDGGMLVGVQPTGRTFEVQHIHMYRVLDGKIAEHFANRDDVGMMRQLGLLPPPPSLSGQ